MGLILLLGSQRRAHVIGMVLDSALQQGRHVRAFPSQVFLPPAASDWAPTLTWATSPRSPCLMIPGEPTEFTDPADLAPLSVVGLLPGWECMAEVGYNGEEWLQWENVLLSSGTCTVLILMVVTSKFNHYFWYFLFSSFPFLLLLCTSLAFMVSLVHSWDYS